MGARSQPGLTSPRALLRALADNWWLWLLRGVAAIAFGVLAFLWPDLTLLLLTFIWGAYAIVDGILVLGAAVSGKVSEIAPRWWLPHRHRRPSRWPAHFRLARNNCTCAAGAYRLLGDPYRGFADLGRYPTSQGNRSRMDVSAERIAFDCSGDGFYCPARRRRSGHGLADRIVRDPRRLHLCFARALA